MVRSKVWRALRIALIASAGLWSEDHIGVRSSRHAELLAGAASQVFYSTPGSYDADRTRDSDLGE